MASYLVLEPPRDAPERVEKAVMIRDGFTLLAFIFPLIWFLWYRMWPESLAFLAVALAIGAVGELSGLSAVVPALSLLVAVLIGLEAQALRAASLRRKGWTEWGVVEGASYDEAEERYAAAAEPAESAALPPAIPPAVSAAPRAARSGTGARAPAFGLIDYPRKT